MDQYIASPVAALTTSVLLQVLKNMESVPWISRQTGRLNMAISLTMALFSALAISFSYDASTGDFSMSGNIWAIFDVLQRWVVQWAEQHAFYKVAIALPEAAGETRALNREILGLLKGLVPPALPPAEKPDEVMP